MDIYFNPYPGAAKDEDTGIKCAVKTADALTRLKRNLSDISLRGVSPGDDIDMAPSKFVLIKAADTELSIGDIIFKASAAERDKLKLLLQTFSKGRIIDSGDLGDIEDWIVTNIGAAAPILELAAKRKAIALTFPTESVWCVDILNFEGRSENLPNLWGQDDISEVTGYCIRSLRNARERFAVQFAAEFCGDVLNTAPDSLYWEAYNFFYYMKRASERSYAVDFDLIKNVGSTKYGSLLELRCHESAYRIFFVYRNNLPIKVLIGGFYRKGAGGGKGQNEAIRNACKRINAYVEVSH
jgi:hypothetical protein